MKFTLTEAIIWLIAIGLITSCSMRPIPIGRGVQIEEIKIEPRKGTKSVYRPERFV